MRKWIPLLMLCAAQFVMVLDTSVMNVSITTIVNDLDTTIQGVQSAITVYTLVMAAFMLLGAKLGDVFGRTRAFEVGMVVYGLGSLITSLSPNLTVLMIGWSGIEGFGAVLVIPAIAALTAASYEGKDRALAFALIGATSAVAVAAGPLIGGWVTTEFSWRYVFAGETVVMLLLLSMHRFVPKVAAAPERPKLDWGGIVLSATALALIVLGVLKSSTWGFIEPKDPPEIGGSSFEPLGFSPAIFMVLGGFVLLAAFVGWEERRARRGESQLLNPDLLASKQLRAGLSSLIGQQFVLMGTFFVLPIYLQVVVGLNAFDTGVRLLPLSIAMLIFALAGPKLAARRSPRTVAQAGLVLLSIGSVVMLSTLELKLDDTGFAIALLIMGAGAGLIASQLGNVIMSSVPAEASSEGGGLQGTAQNLGSSLGTAIVGAVLIAALSTGFSERVGQNDSIPASTRQELQGIAGQGLDIVPVDEVESELEEGGLTEDQAQSVAGDYGDAELDALRLALGAVAAGALFSLWFTRRLPTKALADTGVSA